MTRPENLYHGPQIFTEAIHWLEVVGEFDHKIPKPDTPYNRDNDRVFRLLGNKIAEDDYHTMHLLASLDREARLHIRTGDHTTDEDVQNAVRSNQFYSLARLLNSYAAVN